MRPLLIALALLLAPAALAQTADVAGTWSAVTARPLLSEGDTIVARSAQTLVLHADGDAVTGLSHLVMAIPNPGEWGILERCAEKVSARPLDGRAEADGTVRFTTRAGRPEDGVDRTYTARLSADGAELVVTPAFESPVGPVTYRRVALAAR